MSSEERDLLAEIKGKLDILIALTATAGKDEDAQIDLLTSLGYRPSFIARIMVSRRIRLPNGSHVGKRPVVGVGATPRPTKESRRFRWQFEQRMSSQSSN